MNILISAKELLDITLKSIPECVEKEMKRIEEELLSRAEKGIRRYEYSPGPEVYKQRDTIQALLVKAGYKASIWTGTGGTTIEIFW